MIRRTTESTLFPYTTLFRSRVIYARSSRTGIAWVIEVGMIQHVKGFGAKLKIDALRDLEVLHQSGIKVPKIGIDEELDRKSTRLNSSHMSISYAVFCLKKKK